LGGFGFGTIFNLYTWVQEKVKSMVRRLILKKNYRYKPQVFSFNSRFIVVCNVTVIILATISFFVLEQNHSLMADKSSFGRWVTPISITNSTRYAGFNSMELSFIIFPALFMFVTLKWIQVSLGSTVRVLKLYTIANSLMNIVALAKGKESIEIY